MPKGLVKCFVLCILCMCEARSGRFTLYSSMKLREADFFSSCVSSASDTVIFEERAEQQMVMQSNELENASVHAEDEEQGPNWKLAEKNVSEIEAIEKEQDPLDVFELVKRIEQATELLKQKDALIRFLKLGNYDVTTCIESLAYVLARLHDEKDNCKQASQTATELEEKGKTIQWQLQDTEKKLKDTEKKLNDTQKMLNDTEKMLNETQNMPNDAQCQLQDPLDTCESSLQQERVYTRTLMTIPVGLMLLKLLKHMALRCLEKPLPALAAWLRRLVTSVSTSLSGAPLATSQFLNTLIAQREARAWVLAERKKLEALRAALHGLLRQVKVDMKDVLYCLSELKNLQKAGLCPGCWCGGLHHQSTQTLADSDRWTPSSSSGSSSCLSRPALRTDGGGLVGLG